MKLRLCVAFVAFFCASCGVYRADPGQIIKKSEDLGAVLSPEESDVGNQTLEGSGGENPPEESCSPQPPQPADGENDGSEDGKSKEGSPTQQQSVEQVRQGKVKKVSSSSFQDTKTLQAINADTVRSAQCPN